MRPRGVPASPDDDADAPRAMTQSGRGGSLGSRAARRQAHEASGDAVRVGTDVDRPGVGDAHEVSPGAGRGTRAWTTVTRMTPMPQWGQIYRAAVSFNGQRSPAAAQDRIAAVWCNAC